MKKIAIVLTLLIAIAAIPAFADAPIDGLHLGVDAMGWESDSVIGVAWDISPTDMPIDLYGAIGVTDTYFKFGISTQPGKKNNFFGIYAGGGVTVGKEYKTTTFSDGQSTTVTFTDNNLWWNNQQSQEVNFTDTDSDTYFNGYVFDGIGEVGLEFDFKYVSTKVGYVYYAGDHLMNVAFLVGY